LLAGGTTYYLSTSNTVMATNSGEASLRAFAAGGNTAPGGTANPLARWIWSNGSTTGVRDATWTAGTVNDTHPGALTEEATAFDIDGALAPEPGTLTLLSLALAACWFYVRRRTA